MADPTVHPIVTLKEARERGLPRYFTGKRCTHGHVAERYTNNSLCCQCAFLRNHGEIPTEATRAAERSKIYGDRLITQAEARRLGQQWYFTGRPCIHGHIGERATSDNSCRECRDEMNARRRMEKAAENKAYDRAHYAAKRDAILERHRLHRINNPEKYRARAKAQYVKRRPYNIAYSRKRYLENPERMRQERRAWAKANPDKVRAQWQRRRARKFKAEGRYSADDIRRILKLQKYRCAYCPRSLRKAYHVDHIIALANGGSNWPSNLQCLCPTCNIRKSSKDPIDFARATGRLL